MQIEQFEIVGRFRGPPRSGNGGYTAGRIARHLPGTVSVRLKAPPPLDAALRLESSAEAAQLFHGATLVGEARRAEPLDLPVPPCPSLAKAEEAARHYVGFKAHHFPGCFVCGPDRAPGDGLCIFPGPLDGTPTVAAPWTPEASLADSSTGLVQPEFLWSALDCAGAFALYPLPENVSIVLGELTASFMGDVRAGDRCIVLGWPLGGAGRKRFAGTAIYGPQGRLVAAARAVWVEIDARTWG